MMSNPSAPNGKSVEVDAMGPVAVGNATANGVTSSPAAKVGDGNTPSAATTDVLDFRITN